MSKLIEAFNDSVREITCKVEIYFDGFDNDPYVIDYDSDLIMSFELLEELAVDSDSPVGSIVANELAIELYNKNDMFNPLNTEGIFYNKITINTPIKLYVQEVRNDTGWIPLGTFFVADWNCSNASQTCSIVAYDYMAQFMALPAPLMLVSKDTSVGEFLLNMAVGAGLEPSSIIIDPILLTQKMTYSYMLDGTIKDTLQKITEAHLFYIWFNREGKLATKSLKSNDKSVATLTDDNQIMSINIEESMLKSFSAVDVSYVIKAYDNQQLVATVSDYALYKGTNYINNIKPTKGPVYTVDFGLYNGEDNVLISNIEYNPWKFNVIAESPVETISTIEIYGRPLITKTTLVIHQENERLVDTMGMKLIQVENEYIDSKEVAEQLAKVLLNFVSNAASVVNMNTRGNPGIEIGSTVTIDDTFDNVHLEGILTKQHIRFDGSITADMTCLNRSIKEVRYEV